MFSKILHDFINSAAFWRGFPVLPAMVECRKWCRYGNKQWPCQGQRSAPQTGRRCLRWPCTASSTRQDRVQTILSYRKISCKYVISGRYIRGVASLRINPLNGGLFTCQKNSSAPSALSRPLKSFDEISKNCHYVWQICYKNTMICLVQYIFLIKNSSLYTKLCTKRGNFLLRTIKFSYTTLCANYFFLQEKYFAIDKSLYSYDKSVIHSGNL